MPLDISNTLGTIRAEFRRFENTVGSLGRGTEKRRFPDTSQRTTLETTTTAGYCTTISCNILGLYIVFNNHVLGTFIATSLRLLHIT
jgi:hypothetical protein